MNPYMLIYTFNWLLNDEFKVGPYTWICTELAHFE